MSLPSTDISPLFEALLSLSTKRDVDAVLQTIVDRARTMADARYAALGIPDAAGQRLERFFFSGLSAETEKAIGKHPTGRGLLGIMLRDGRPVRVRRATKHPRSVGVPANHPPIEAMLGVPIKTGEDVAGDLYVANKIGADEFSVEDQERLEALARHAALALRLARLMERQAESERRYRLLVEGAPDLVFALDDAGEITYANGRALAITGYPAAEVVGRTLASLFIAEDEAVVDVNLAAVRSGAPRTSFTASLVEPEGGVRHVDVSIVPSGAAEGGLQGIARDVTAQRSLAQEIAERTSELLSTMEERRRLREFVSLVIQAQEEERARIAGDLHDTTVQTLTAIGRRLRSLSDRHDADPEVTRQELGDLAEAAMAEAEEVRRLSRNLRPSVLDHLGLAAALDHLVKEESRRGLKAHLAVRGDAARLGDRQRTTLFRIAQEALTNIRRHSQAAHADVTLDVAASEARLEIRDDGRGFDPVDVERSRIRLRRLGLAGMRERADMLGGELEIVSRPSDGTRVIARLPLDSPT